MGIELDLDLGKEEVSFRQRLWQVYKQLNAYGRRSVGDYDSWAESELKAFRKGKRAGHDYGEWLQSRNHIPDHVAKAEMERSNFVAGEIRELESLFGSTHARLREQPGMREIADNWWNSAVNELQEGRAGTAWSVAPRMESQLQQINHIAAVRVQQEEAQMRAREASKTQGVKSLKPQF